MGQSPDDAGRSLDDAEASVDAGPFLAWWGQIQTAIAGQGESHVPCGGCTACCTSAQFVPIGPDEADTLAHIPAELLFAAPGLPAGHRLLGYDAAGRCPMLVDGACSIYAHRPRTCRTYDCRVFPATGVEVGDEKPAIAARAARWRFAYPTAADQDAHEQLLAVAASVDDREPRAGDRPPATATQRAVLAVEAYAASQDPPTHAP